MSDAELAQIQRDIDDQLESYPRVYFRIGQYDYHLRNSHRGRILST